MVLEDVGCLVCLRDYVRVCYIFCKYIKFDSSLFQVLDLSIGVLCEHRPHCQTNVCGYCGGTLRYSWVHTLGHSQLHLQKLAFPLGLRAGVRKNLERETGYD